MNKDISQKMAKEQKLFFQTEKGKEYTRNKNRENAKNGTHPAQSVEFRKQSSERAKARNSVMNKIPCLCNVCGKTILGKPNIVRHQKGKNCIKS